MSRGSGATQLIWRDGTLVPWDDAQLHVMSHVVHYGSSIFEGIRCYKTPTGGAVFRLREHMRRLVDSAHIHRMASDFSLDALCDAVVETVGASEFDACYIRPIVFRGHGPMGVNPLKNPVVTAIALTDNPASPLAQSAKHAFYLDTTGVSVLRSMTAFVVFVQAMATAVAAARGTEARSSLLVEEELLDTFGVYHGGSR